MTVANWSDVAERAETDPEFLNRLRLDGKTACREVGVELPAGTKIEILERGPLVQHLFLESSGYSPEIDAMLSRAKNDAAFKAQLLDDPNSVVESALGEKLPDGFNVVIHQRQPGRLYMLLSNKEAGGELSDHELESVAGGTLKGLLTRIGNVFCPNNSVGVVDYGNGTSTLYVDKSIGGLEQV